MKKSVLIAVLGVAASVASSYGQAVYFTSYSANNATGAYTYLFGTTTPIPDGFKADLYYALGTVSDSVNNLSAPSVSALPSGLTSLGIVGITYAGGFFNDPTPHTIPGYTSGAVTFEVVAYNGASYASSGIRGRSGSFTMTSLPGAPSPTASLGDNGDPFPTFYVVAVPEPTTLALAGLGGLAALVAYRRKQA